MGFFSNIIKTIKTFQTICAQCEKDPCCDWVGEEGAGHFVKMVHNGIEYGKKKIVKSQHTVILEYLNIKE